MIYCDVPEPLQFGFQDPASPAAIGIEDLHNYIMYYIFIIVIGVTYLILISIVRFNNNLTLVNINHGSLLEIIWTLVPTLVLMVIAFPSFRLLYLMDEVIDPIITIKVIGKQWYWTVEYSDYTENQAIEFDSYLIPTDELELGQLRMLDVDNPIVIPVDTNVRFIITADDVIHSWVVPSFGVKVDAIPGRLNQVSVIPLRTGLFYGSCSELCGVNHNSMPITVKVVEIEEFISWLNNQ